MDQRTLFVVSMAWIIILLCVIVALSVLARLGHPPAELIWGTW